jgi:hypothetical protein
VIALPKLAGKLSSGNLEISDDDSDSDKEEEEKV